MRDDLGDRMKGYEAQLEQYARPDQYIVLRLDGRGFSKYTKGMEKPFDISMTTGMIKAAFGVYFDFNAKAAYTQSDEITIVIAPKFNEDVGKYIDHIFGGRLQKITTLAAAKASVVLDRNIGSTLIPTFDCRAMLFDNIHEVVNSVFWRMQDCKRNATSCLYRYTFGHSQMQGKSCAVMREELGDKWTNLETCYSCGTLIKNGEIVDFGVDSEMWTSHAYRMKTILS